MRILYAPPLHPTGILSGSMSPKRAALLQYRIPQPRIGSRKTNGAPSMNQVDSPALRPICVLVLEDHVHTAKLLTTKLKDTLQCRVMVAHSLKQAHQVLQENHQTITIAVCDLNLPDGKHGEVIDAIAQFSIPIIALTAEVSEELRDTILKKGVVDYVLKDNTTALQYVADLVHRTCKNAQTKVLLVDDSNATRQLLKLYLNQQNLDVLTAQNGIEALEVLAGHPEISLIITDYEMPYMDGARLVFEVRKNFGKDQLAIIGLSASSDGKLSARFLKSGANDFIHKPFIYEEILCRVNQNLEMLDLLKASKQAATQDFLTGLYNRRHFFESGGKLLHAARKAGQDVHMAMIDIDNFKSVNDSHGHDQGDIALVQTARNLMQHFPHNLLCRLGGEEFAVLFIDQNALESQQLLENFRLYQQQHPMAHGTMEPIKIEVSIGLAHGTPAMNIDRLLKEADTRLYLAKHLGKNQIAA
jgi:diguanylate cyclase (GGDEF)-like protein